MTLIYISPLLTAREIQESPKQLWIDKQTEKVGTFSDLLTDWIDNAKFTSKTNDNENSSND